jgi:hypothetical protein
MELVRPGSLVDHHHVTDGAAQAARHASDPARPDLPVGGQAYEIFPLASVPLALAGWLAGHRRDAIGVGLPVNLQGPRTNCNKGSLLGGLSLGGGLETDKPWTIRARVRVRGACVTDAVQRSKVP